VYATLFVFETMIVKIGGKQWFEGLVNEFYSSTGEPTSKTIIKRWAVVKNYF